MPGIGLGVLWTQSFTLTSTIISPLSDVYSKSEIARPEYSIPNTYTKSHPVIGQEDISSMVISWMMVSNMKMRNNMRAGSTPSGTHIVEGSQSQIQPVALTFATTPSWSCWRTVGRSPAFRFFRSSYNVWAAKS